MSWRGLSVNIGMCFGKCNLMCLTDAREVSNTLPVLHKVIPLDMNSRQATGRVLWPKNGKGTTRHPVSVLLAKADWRLPQLSKARLSWPLFLEMLCAECEVKSPLLSSYASGAHMQKKRPSLRAKPTLELNVIPTISPYYHDGTSMFAIRQTLFKKTNRCKVKLVSQFCSESLSQRSVKHVRNALTFLACLTWTFGITISVALT